MLEKRRAVAPTRQWSNSFVAEPIAFFLNRWQQLEKLFISLGGLFQDTKPSIGLSLQVSILQHHSPPGIGCTFLSLGPTLLPVQWMRRCRDASVHRCCLSMPSSTYKMCIQATVNATGGQKLFSILPPPNSCLVLLNLVPLTVSYLVSKTVRIWQLRTPNAFLSVENERCRRASTTSHHPGDTLELPIGTHNGDNGGHCEGPNASKVYFWWARKDPGRSKLY